jgi:uncharacterized protein (TIGR02598 family)
MKKFRDSPESRCLAGRGFTLIEVVLAVGIIAFCLTAVIGLVGLAVKGTREADVYVRLAGINRRVVADIQRQPFLTISGTLSSSQAVKSYYDLTGNPLTDLYGSNLTANKGEKYFECEIRNVTPASGYSSNAKILGIRIRWPHPNYAETNSSITSVLNSR